MTCMHVFHREMQGGTHSWLTFGILGHPSCPQEVQHQLMGVLDSIYSHLSLHYSFFFFHLSPLAHSLVCLSSSSHLFPDSLIHWSLSYILNIFTPHLRSPTSQYKWLFIMPRLSQVLMDLPKLLWEHRFTPSMTNFNQLLIEETLP